VNNVYSALYYTNSSEGELSISYRLTYFCSYLTLIAVFFCLSASASAQTPVGQPADTTNMERMRQQDMSNREYQLRNLGVAADKALDDRQKKALMTQVDQDFKRILTLHNELMRAVNSEAPVDYHFISEASAEINKRSTRLQSTLWLRQSDEEKPDSAKTIQSDTSKIKYSLIKLCTYIKDFVTNPIIETPGTVDAKYLARAKSDLASVINLSGLIRKQLDQIPK
jgi:hypothetical protein